MFDFTSNKNAKLKSEMHFWPFRLERERKEYRENYKIIQHKQ